MTRLMKPLAGRDQQILDALMATGDFDRVCEIGRYRKAWRPSDVHRVACTHLAAHPTAPPAPSAPDPARRRAPKRRPNRKPKA